MFPADTMASLKTDTETARWTTTVLRNGRLSATTTTILYDYDPALYSTDDVHKALEFVYPEFYYDWTVHNGEVHLFRNAWRQGRWESLSKTEKAEYEKEWKPRRALVGRTC